MNSSIVFALFGALTFILCIAYFKKGIRLKKVCGSRVNARITNIEAHQSDKQREYTPVYSYRINGVDYEARGSRTKSRKKYKVGDESFVIYNPENPKDCLIEGKNPNIPAGILFVILSALFFTFAICL